MRTGEDPLRLSLSPGPPREESPRPRVPAPVAARGVSQGGGASRRGSERKRRLARGDWLLVPQDPPQEFPLQRSRELRDELDDPRQLVDRDVLAAAVEDLLLQLIAARVAGLQDDERLDVLAADRVGNPDHARVGYGGVLQESVLDLLGTDAVAGALDQVLLARHEAQVSVLVYRAEVADQNPPFADHGLLLLQQAILERAPVDRSRGTTGIEPAQLSRLGDLAFLRDDLDLVPGDRGADRSRLDLPVGHAGHEDVHHLRSAQALVDLLVEASLPVEIGLGRQRLAAARQDAQAR